MNSGQVLKEGGKGRPQLFLGGVGGGGQGQVGFHQVCPHDDTHGCQDAQVLHTPKLLTIHAKVFVMYFSKKAVTWASR